MVNLSRISFFDWLITERWYHESKSYHQLFLIHHEKISIENSSMIRSYAMIFFFWTGSCSVSSVTFVWLFLVWIDEYLYVSGTVPLCGVSDEEERVRYYDTSLRDCTILACQIWLCPLGTALHSVITYVFTEKMCHTYRSILIFTVVLNVSFNFFFFSIYHEI